MSFRGFPERSPNLLYSSQSHTLALHFTNTLAEGQLVRYRFPGLLEHPLSPPLGASFGGSDSPRFGASASRLDRFFFLLGNGGVGDFGPMD